MINGGVYTLCSTGVTVAVSGQAQTAITDLGGMTAVSLEAEFLYGSGGTTGIVVVQTRLGAGNWRDIARFDFATTALTKYAELSGLLSKGVTSYAALSAEGVSDGFLGDELRAVLTSTGVYSNTTLSVRASVR